MKELEQLTPIATATIVTVAPQLATGNDSPTISASPPRKRRSIFASYERHIEQDTSVSTGPTTIAARPSITAIVMMYIDNLPTLIVQTRRAAEPWALFRSDKRFV